MIHIEFDRPITDEWESWRRSCESETSKICVEVDEKPTDDEDSANVSAIYKRDSIRKNVYFSKTGPFNGKCVYCECYITDFERPDIEHFRPKGAVKDINGDEVFVDGVKHGGYYWLAYDDSNLMPSCQICNQATVIDGHSIGKHDRFPVSGEYVIRSKGTPANEPPSLDNEFPLLLNPLEDDPEDHLSVDVKTGILSAKTDRGQACIDVFGLNVRDQLVEDRKRAVRDFKALLGEYINDVTRRDEVFSEMRSILHGVQRCTLAARKFAREIAPIRDVRLGE